jgi:HAD superfamily hydrolase (TIGR01509 family)
MVTLRRMRAPIRVVFFDLMDTVIRDPYREALIAATGLALHDAARLRDPEVWPAFETGRIDEETFARTYFRRLNPTVAPAESTGLSAAPQLTRPFDLPAFHRARHEGYAFLPGMRELVRCLEGRATRAIASNYPCWIDEVSARFELHGLFEHVLASCHLGVRKPAPEFYERILERVGASADSCLFVDDRADNCVAAERVGMRAHLFTTSEALRGDLVSYALLDVSL